MFFLLEQLRPCSQNSKRNDGPTSKAAATKTTTTVTRTECGADPLVSVRPVPGSSCGILGHAPAPHDGCHAQDRQRRAGLASARWPADARTARPQAAATMTSGSARCVSPWNRAGSSVDLQQRRQRERPGGAGDARRAGGSTAARRSIAAAARLPGQEHGREVGTHRHEKAPMSSEVGPVHTARSRAGGDWPAPGPTRSRRSRCP